ncbi:hypothetical protein EBZ80_21135 [bacterium]|nr:hypothetical protein [bacterium]
MFSSASLDAPISFRECCGVLALLLSWTALLANFALLVWIAATDSWKVQMFFFISLAFTIVTFVGHHVGAYLLEATGEQRPLNRPQQTTQRVVV